MTVDPANASELKQIAAEIGADILEGDLRYPSATGGWRLGDLDLSEYLHRYRGQRLMLIIAPVGAAEPETYTCGICGFVHDEYGECPRCKLASEHGLLRLPDDSEGAAILDQVKRFLGNPDRD